MRRLLSSVLSALLTVLVALTVVGALPSAPAQAVPNTNLTGIATIGGMPVPEGNEVELLLWDSSTSQWGAGYGGSQDSDGYTDATGAFAFHDIYAGDYTLRLHGHYANGSTTPPAGPGAPGTVNLAAGETKALDLALPVPSSLVNGRVLALDGSPVDGALVELGVLDPLAQSGPSKIYSTTTAADGSYTLPLFGAVHDYTITAWVDGYLRTLLGDTTKWWEAESFLVDADVLTDLTLQAQHVGGRVTSASGALVTGQTITLNRWNQANQLWVPFGTATTSSQGRYVFTDIGEGHFTVTFGDLRGPVFPQTGFTSPVPGLAIDRMSGPGYRWVSGSAEIDDLDLVLAPAQPGAVGIRGTREPGRVLSAVPSAWTAGWQLTHQWLRNGTPISGATGATYRLTRSDAGRKVSVRVSTTTTYPGLAGGSTTSSPVTIKKLSTLGLSLTAGRRKAVAAIRLTLAGVTAARTTGRVAVYVDGRLRTRVSLQRGLASLTIRNLRAGRHTVEVRFAATATHASTSTRRTVRVR